MKNPTLTGLILLNMFDIALHVAVGRVEPIRITGNVLIILAACFAVFSSSSSQQRSAVAIGLLSYIGLNVWFILQSGIGLIGFGLIALTIVLAGMFVWRKPSV